MERFLKNPLCQACMLYVQPCLPHHPTTTTLHLCGYILIRAALSQQPCGHEYSGGKAAALPAERGALARGSPETTPCYLSIWALSASPTPRTHSGPRADLHVHSATLTGAASSHVQEYLLAGPSVWGRKSQRGLAGLRWQEPPTRCSNSGNPL